MSIALSYSRLSTYERCPRKFRSQYVTKTYPDESDNPAFVKGNRLHSQLEEYVKQKALGNTCTKDMAKAAANAVPIIENMFQKFDTIYAEQQIAIDSDFKATDWFSRSAYYRMISDFVAVKKTHAAALDWKSGKVRDYDDTPTGQLHLVAVILFSIHPRLEKITTAYMFLEHKQTIVRVFERKDLDKLREPFRQAYITVNSDNEFEPKVNRYCHFCKINSSECEFKK